MNVKLKIEAAIVLLLEIIMAFTMRAFSESMTEYSRTYSLYTDLMSSYAWNDNYVFKLKGAQLDSDGRSYWFPVHYALSRIDKDIGDHEVLLGYFSYVDAQLIGCSDYVYLFRQYWDENYEVLEEMQNHDISEGLPILSDDEQPGSCFIIKLDYEGNEVENMRIELGDYCKDYIMAGNEVYLVTDSRLFKYNILNHSLNVVYESDTPIINSYSSNRRLFYYENSIYLRTESTIISVDIDTGLSHIILKDVCYLYWQFDARYEYIVLDGYLYIWDFHLREMIAVNVISGETETISKNVYLFNQVTDEGVMIYEIDAAYIDEYYAACETRGTYSYSIRSLPVGLSGRSLKTVYVRFDNERVLSIIKLRDSYFVKLANDFNTINLGNGEFLLATNSLESDLFVKRIS